MYALKLNRRAVDAFHALRMEPFVKLLLHNAPSFDPRTKSFHFQLTLSETIFRLTMAGHQRLAIALRDHHVQSVTVRYSGEYFILGATATDPVGNTFDADLHAIAPGIHVALSQKLVPEIESALSKADRYVRHFAKVVFCSPELLLNATHHGICFRVRTDTPRIDAQLLPLLDEAASRTNAVVVALRVVRRDNAGNRQEHLLPPRVVERGHPMRPLAINAIRSLFTPTDASRPFPL